MQSTGVATAYLCDYLFKLSYPYVVVSGTEDDFVVADMAHEIMSLIALRIVPEQWKHNLGKAEVEGVIKAIQKDSEDIIRETIDKTKDRVRGEGKRHLP